MQQNLANTFFNRVASLNNAIAVRYKESHSPYRSLSWQEYGRLVKELAFGLAAHNIEPEQRISILSNTSHLWVACDLAIMSNGAVSVPIYPTAATADLKHILLNSQAQMIFVQTESLLNKVLSIKNDLPDLKKIILLSALNGGKSLSELAITPHTVYGLEELQEAGRVLMAEKPELIGKRIESTNSSALATIIYTSGTTGMPKGVMLTYDNIFGVLNDLPSIFPTSANDTYLSFLPLSHIFERVCGEFYWLQKGGVCAFAEGIEHFAKNMSEIDPTMILVVPRVLDRIYAKVKAGILGATGRARKLIEWSIEVGLQTFKHKVERRSIRVGLKAKHWLAEKLVFQKLRNHIGRNLRLVVSGGAPATKEVIEFFNAIGINVLEGYGLTETTAPVSVNLPDKIKPGTVGPALPSVKVKIADDGEILVKGPGVFQGYYKTEELTAEVFDSEGWFHTGDIGIIDSNGFIIITDRKKDLIINSAGKNIAPQRIEAILKTVPFVSQAIVFGDKKKHLVAILTVDEHAVMEAAPEKGWNCNNYLQLIDMPEFKQYLRKEINERCKQLADYERIRNFTILPKELSVESGELTATLKIKRNVIAKKYKDVIENLYKDETLINLTR